MTDSVPEFDNAGVREFCASRGIKLHIMPAYSPWIVAPDLGSNEYNAMDVPENWPTHLDEAIRYLNRRVLSLLKISQNDLLSWGSS